MWAEPLTVTSTQTKRDTFITTAHQGDGGTIAHVTCLVDVPTGCGYFGAMIIDDRNGAPKQTMRALTLLTRDALRFAQELGIRHVATNVPSDAQLRTFAEKIAGLEPDARGRMFGDCTAIRSNALDVTDADGNDRTPQGIDVGR